MFIFMLTVAPGGNNLATTCYKDFLGLATINMYYYYYYYYYSASCSGWNKSTIKKKKIFSFSLTLKKKILFRWAIQASPFEECDCMRTP